MYQIGFDPQDPFIRINSNLRLAFRITTFNSEIFIPLNPKVRDNMLYITKMRNLGNGEVKRIFFRLKWEETQNSIVLHTDIDFTPNPIDSVVYLIDLIDGGPVQYIRYVALDGEKRLGNYNAVRSWIPPINYPRFAKMPLWFLDGQEKRNYILWHLEKVESTSVAVYHDSRWRSQIIVASYHPTVRAQASALTIPALEIGTYDDPIWVVAKRLRRLEMAGIITPFELRRDKPAWLDEIRLIVFLHGQHWSGFIHNTFEAMTEAIEVLSKDIYPNTTLFLIMGWDGPYYKSNLNLWPSDALGGEKAFARLIEYIRKIQGKIIVFAPLNAVSYKYALAKRWEKGALHRPWGAKAWCDWTDWDYDLQNEPLLFINLGYQPFRFYLYERYKELVQVFNIDGVYLDITNYWEDDPFFDHYNGVRELVEYLRHLKNDFLVCGENWYDHLLGLFPLFGEPGNERGPGDLLLRYSRSSAYTACPAPGGGGGVHNKGGNYIEDPCLDRKNIPYISITKHWKEHVAALRQKVDIAMQWDPNTSRPNEKLRDYLSQ